MEVTQILWAATLLVPPYKSLTYSIPAYFPPDIWKPGLRVLIPMGAGNRLCPAVLENTVSLDRPARLKFIHWPLEREPLLDSSYIAMVKELSSRNLVEPGRIMAGILPASLRKVRDILVGDSDQRRIPLPGKGQEFEHLRELARLWQAGDLDFKVPRKVSRKIVSIEKDPPWSILPNARVQWKVMDVLWEQGQMPVQRLKKLVGPSCVSSLQSLLNKELISIKEEDAVDMSEVGLSTASSFQPSSDQQKVLDELVPILHENVFHAAILHGITGSGKTLVYISLARQTLESGRSAILLAPEIAIANQLYLEARARMPGMNVHLHHGLKSPSDKENLFNLIRADSRPVLLVGTRSALFMPVSNVGLMVIDEEHDESFKQDQGFIYQAKEIAHYIARRDSSLLLLGSATPDIKTFYAAMQNRISLYTMENRVGQSILPEVNFVDLKVDPPAGGPLSKTVNQALIEVLKKGEQAVIMHNRRGYSPVIMCNDCSETAKCKDCQVSLTYHKSRQRLVCHYCGTSMPFSIICEHCHGSEFLPVGDGTEKIEEFFADKLPEINVLRLDRDSARNPAITEEILSNFAANKAQILVGTQMIGKGHTFPNVTLGIVLDGDLGLGLPDYRSSERIFQLLVQLSGRAGRAQKPGRVFIQTRNPKHYCWKYVKNCDYQGFFDQEISKRKLFGYPPFVRLGLIRISFPSGWSGQDQLIKTLRTEARNIATRYGIRIMGPAPAPLSRLRKRDRHQCLIKADSWQKIRSVYKELLPVLGSNKEIRCGLDLDPVNML
ncbi:replication restart helicase PriA [Desulfonatronovibrio magnus]|uniref:replication restart helicase PriA n=1 Tax=Desulfonatronovibrio magnus TaxID=698827 RepID=UPI0005EB96C1|nr:primosomal protein N' [Desulfonatronovibrio magnus]